MSQLYFDNVTIQFNLFGIIMDPELMSAHSLSLSLSFFATVNWLSFLGKGGRGNLDTF